MLYLDSRASGSQSTAPKMDIICSPIDPRSMCVDVAPCKRRPATGNECPIHTDKISKNNVVCDSCFDLGKGRIFHSDTELRDMIDAGLKMTSETTVLVKKKRHTKIIRDKQCPFPGCCNLISRNAQYCKPHKILTAGRIRIYRSFKGRDVAVPMSFITATDVSGWRTKEWK